MKSVCLCGSFQFYDQIVQLKGFFDIKGIVCYKPTPFKYRNPKEPSRFTNAWFKLPYDKKLEESRRAELTHLEKISKADVTYIVNPSKYVGNTVILEIGYAYAKGKPIYSLEPIEDPAVMSLILKTIEPKDLVEVLERDCNSDCYQNQDEGR